MGSASGFAPAESMPDHVTLTKYNALVYRAQQQRQAKVHTAVDTDTQFMGSSRL